MYPVNLYKKYLEIVYPFFSLFIEIIPQAISLSELENVCVYLLNHESLTNFEINVHAFNFL